MPEKLLTVKELAEFLNLTQRQIYSLIKDDIIPFLKVGGSYRFDKDEVIRHLKKPPVSVKLKTELKLEFLAKLNSELEKQNLKIILVGGQAVEFYTGGGYTTGDIDVICSNPDSLGKMLIKMGFSKEGRFWINNEQDLFIECPSDHFNGKTIKVNMQSGPLYISSPEDMIVDRLCAAKFWKSDDDLRWAKEILIIQEDLIDESYLIKRAKAEQVHDFLEKIK
jgi:excisionase family DNA binding protein